MAAVTRWPQIDTVEVVAEPAAGLADLRPELRFDGVPYSAELANFVGRYLSRVPAGEPIRASQSQRPNWCPAATNTPVTGVPRGA